MRFARLRTKNASAEPPAASPANRVLFVAYNVAWWVPAVLPIFGVMSYRVGLTAFLGITIFRAAANVYRNNVLPVEAAQRFALRSP